MNEEGGKYYWRHMSVEDRKNILKQRQMHRLPWHGPPHYQSDCDHYLISTACYEHRHHIGLSSQRIAAFESALLEAVHSQSQQIYAWIVLTNHYHLLVHAREIKSLLSSLGKLHGSTSHRWNGEEDKRGRQVWHRAAETAIKSEGHFYASLNYVLNNAVRHGYVERWQDWPYSNAEQYLAEVGREEAERRWRQYPLLDFGKEWDPPEL